MHKIQEQIQNKLRGTVLLERHLEVARDVVAALVAVFTPSCTIIQIDLMNWGVPSTTRASLRVCQRVIQH